MWTVDTQYRSWMLTSMGGSTIKIKIPKMQYFEIFTASVYSNNVGVYYYGNNSSKDAYVYIREGLNCEVAH